MLLRELKDLVASTADAAFAIDDSGLVVAWNAAAEAMFNRLAAEVLGQPCNEILQGIDECGPVCAPDCHVIRAHHCQQAISNFDLHVPSAQGRQWCNISTLRIEIAQTTAPYAVHIIRGIDVRKRLELLVRDFIVGEAKLSLEEAHALVTSTRSSARTVELTSRELEILRLLAKGVKTSAIASQLHISRTTVNNHTQHLLHKLNAHTRLEAIRRAEHAGLI